ncbi:PREDICTED: uncharacterized protein LOC106808827 [Priapulus caudatus]|uniref:Uncharacterized protein LOC106808827 n=1 Tax=Priapulus caudatus TaxID=37621 RepID=A0ABM1E4R3_PRICU|nr:PREDICTED: uncharacterized protein LOC106808827 [Priapulus caudatus]
MMIKCVLLIVACQVVLGTTIGCKQVCMWGLPSESCNCRFQFFNKRNDANSLPHHRDDEGELAMTLNRHLQEQPSYLTLTSLKNALDDLALPPTSSDAARAPNDYNTYLKWNHLNRHNSQES